MTRSLHSKRIFVSSLLGSAPRVLLQNSNLVKNYKSKSGAGAIQTELELYRRSWSQNNRFGSNPGAKLAEPLKIPSLLYTKNILKIRLQNVPSGAAEPQMSGVTSLHHDGV